jgi:hypothetical protein
MRFYFLDGFRFTAKVREKYRHFSHIPFSGTGAASPIYQYLTAEWQFCSIGEYALMIYHLRSIAYNRVKLGDVSLL